MPNVNGTEQDDDLRTEVRELSHVIGSMERRLDGVEQRLGAVDQHLAAIDQRLGAVDQHLAAVDQRLGAVDQHLAAVDQRLGAVDQHLGVLGETVASVEATLKHVATKADMYQALNTQTWKVSSFGAAMLAVTFAVARYL